MDAPGAGSGARRPRSHLGDYIYEYGPNVYQVDSGNVRLHDGPEVASLESYRNRHALYKTDPDLQDAHANFPWILTWDDHEVDNNWADEIPEDEDFDIQDFLVRRANAFQGLLRAHAPPVLGHAQWSRPDPVPPVALR